jgi:dihydrolipoamide dehydrogenase
MTGIRDVDVAVIGAGSAGLVAFGQVRKHTDSAVLIEEGNYGTTCARVGCMPSKLLIAAAEAAHRVGAAERFGVLAGPPRIDGVAVMDRVRRERDRFVRLAVQSMHKRIGDEQRVRGRARFVEPGLLEIDGGERIRAGRIVIATGSRTNIVPPLKPAGDRLITSDDVFDWTDLPESVAVFGPGVIGLELGQALARLGVRVRMFGVGGALGPIRDPAIRALALEGFREEFPLDPDADVESIQAQDDGVLVRWRDGGSASEERFDWLLAATGRRPNVDDLGLEHSGLALDERGVPFFDRFTMQCGQAPVFIAGDVNNDAPLLHEAADEGRIAGANAGRWPDVRAGLRRCPLAIVFTDPQIAQVGLTRTEAEARCGEQLAVGGASLRNQGRARTMGRDRGEIRLFGQHGTRRFLGGELYGPEMEHIAHLLAWAAQQRMTVPDMLAMPFYHPVVEEGLRSALRDLNAALKQTTSDIDECLDCGPGT